MGIPGILKEIGKGNRVALSKLAVDHLQRTKRPLRIAIDAAIWSFQNQASQGGLNPALRVLYYRLVRLLALPIHPLFIFDGRNKPKVKRNKKVGVWNSAEYNLTKELLQLFHFPYLTAPGEAEAECAALQRCGIVDAVMSQDADAVMFGSTFTLKNWSAEAQRGSHAPTHVDTLRSDEILDRTGLDTNGMILVALMSGGDYDTTGIPGFGPGIACEIAKIKTPNFASDLLAIKSRGDQQALREWRERLNHELRTNESKFFKRKHNISIPEDFPDDTVLNYYTSPAVSSGERLKEIEHEIMAQWAKEINIPLNMQSLREFTRENFDWKYKSGARKFIRGMTPSLLSQQLRLRQPLNGIIGVNSVLSRGERFEHDGIPEIRVQLVPTQIVPIDLAEEADNPINLPMGEEANDLAEQADNLEATAEPDLMSSQADIPMTPSKRKKSPPWNPDEPEKYWLPETIVKTGLPGVVEQWDFQQEELRKDPKKWAVRNIKSKSKTKVMDSKMKAGAMDAFVKAAKPGISNSTAKPPSIEANLTGPNEPSRRHQQTRPKAVATKKTVVSSPRKERSIAHFFQPYARTEVGGSLQSARTFCTSSITSSTFSKSTFDEFPDIPASPTPRKATLINPGGKIVEVIELSSSPITSFAPSSTQTYTSGPEDKSIPNHQDLENEPSLPPSWTEMLPSSSSSTSAQLGHDTTMSTTQSSHGVHVRSSSPAFEEMTPRPRSDTRKRSEPNHDSHAGHRSKVRKSPPITSTFKTSKATMSKKISAVTRDSLPGAWKEVALLEEEDMAINSGEPRTTGGNQSQKNAYRRARVSLVDLT